MILSLVVVYQFIDAHTPWRGIHDDYSYTHGYALQVFPATSESYALLCPIPVAYSDNSSYALFLEKAYCDSDDVVLSIETTEHGVALAITGTGSANISWYSHWESDSGELYSTLSMLSTNDSHATSALAFVESDGGIIGITLKYDARNQYGWGARTWYYSMNFIAVEDGWHQAVMEMGGTLIN